MSSAKAKNGSGPATPLTKQSAHESQAFGHLIELPMALSKKARQ